MKYDIIVIGGGPAGLYLTKLLEEDFRVLVIEEHPSIGRPMACSGLISTNLEKFLPVDESWVEHKVKGAVLKSHTGKEVRLEKPDIAAYVINREKFDSSLSRSLQSKILLNTGAEEISIGDNVKVKTNKGVFESEILIGSDGPNSLVRNHFGVKPFETVQGIIAIDNKPNDDPAVELWFDKDLSDDGFIWKIPRGNSTEYGMLSTKPDFRVLEKKFSLKPGYIKSAGKIPLGIQETVFARTLLIGDAASHVKPWSGGGVIYSFTAAEIAAEVIKKAFEERDFSIEILSEYQEGWKKKFGKQISMGMVFRDVFKNMDNETIDKLFQEAPGKKGLLNNMDMDFPEITISDFL